MLSDRSRYPELEDSADAAFEVLLGLVGGGAPGGARPKVPRSVPLAAWSTVHGLAMLLIDGRLDHASSERRAVQLARDVTRVLGRGLGSHYSLDPPTK